MNDNKVYIKMNKPFDEIYTKKIDADQLVEYLINNNIIDSDTKIWLPFNDFVEGSDNIAYSLGSHGINFLYGNENDFYEESKTFNNYKIIISNPPFSKRTKLFTRLMELDKPFILLQPIQAFNNNSFVKMLCEHSNDFGFLCPKSRMGFIVNGEEKEKKTAFYSFWLCYKTKIKGWKSMEE